MNEKALFASHSFIPNNLTSKELILPDAFESVESMFGDNFANNCSPYLSNDTVAHRIGDIAEEAHHELSEKLRDTLFFNSI